MSPSGDHFCGGNGQERPKRRQKPCGTLGKAREGAPLMLQCHKTRDIFTQVDQGVKFDSGLVAPESSPREKRQAEVDGRGIQGRRRFA
jgi:hypothetical protein